MELTENQLRQIVRKHLTNVSISESVRASEQFSHSGYISLEDDPYERIEVTSDGSRITIDIDSFKSFQLIMFKFLNFFFKKIHFSTVLFAIEIF